MAVRLLYLLAPAFWTLGCGDSETPLAPDPNAPGELRVEVSSLGGPLPDQYSVLVGETRMPIEPSGTLVLSEILPGPVEVALDGVPRWCTVAGQNPRVVQVNAGSLSTVPFSVQCDEESGILARPRGTQSAATIGPDGGEVTATDTDGTQFSLQVPPGALSGPVEVRMTPASMDGLGGVVSSFVGGVIFEPSGLEFQESATFQITPSAGTEQLRYLAGVTFGADGAPEYRLAELDPTGESLLVAVDHFSGAAAAEVVPGAWGALMEAFDQVPHARPIIWGTRVPTGVDQLHDTEVCVIVGTQSDGSGRPHPRVPVSFQSVTGPVRGFVPVEAITNDRGEACARVRVNGMDVDPAGDWVVATVVVLPGAGFESTLRTATWVLDQGSPFGVALEQPVNLVSDVPFQICATVSSTGTDGHPVAGTRVGFETVPSTARASFRFDVMTDLRFDVGVTGADGRGCATALFELTDAEPGQDEFTIRAWTRQLDISAPPREEDWAPSYDLIQAEQTISVERSPLRLELQAPAEARFGEPTEICAVVTRGSTPEDGKDVSFRLVSGPGTFPAIGGDERLGGALTGTRGPGRGCVSLLPGDPEGDETLVLEAFTSLRGGEELVERNTIRITDNRLVLTLSATPSTLSEGGADSRICASLRDESEDRPMPGASVRFVLDGPGVMDPSPGEVLVSDEDGRACADYTAPDPIPDGTTTVTIEATAIPIEFQETVEASVQLTLEEPTRLFSLTATPASISTEGGESQLCGFLRLASDGSPVVGATVRFSHEGPGSVAGASLDILTNGEGRACSTYTAPTPLPDGETPVTLRAVATLSTAADPLEATTVVRLLADEGAGGVVPCAAGVVVGDLSVRGPEQLGSLDGIGTVTRRLSIFGVFSQVTDLRALCEVGDQLRIGSGSTLATEFTGGLRLDGLRSVGLTPGSHTPQPGTLLVERTHGLTELQLPNLERAVATQLGSLLGGGIVFRANRDLTRVVLGRQGGDLRTASIVVESNPILQEVLIRSGIRGTSFSSGSSVPAANTMRVSQNPMLQSIRTDRVWLEFLRVTDNPLLTEIVLGADTEIRSLNITGNLTLQSLDGIPCGTRILSNIHIEGNPQLDVGAVQGLAAGCWDVRPDAVVIIQ